MTRHRFTVLSTPRRLVVGLVVLAGVSACSRQAPPESVPARAPGRPKPIPAPPVAPSAITSTSTLIDAIHDRYAGHWFHTLGFTERTTVSLSSGGQLAQSWTGVEDLPGRQRIDTDVASSSGMLYVRDSTYTFSNGRLTNAAPRTNELLVLGGDLYTQPPARSGAELRDLGFDLFRFHETTWHGDPVYVVGALRGDSLSKQFWVDRDRLLVVRVLERTSQGRTDLRLSDFRRVGDGWVAGQVVQYVNGKRRVTEVYDDLRADVPVSDAMFDPRGWSERRWGQRPRRN
jgi:hypothetical protein